MTVKPDCPVKLTSFQAQRILTQIQLGNYFQSLKGGAATLPPFSGFVSEFDNIAKQFFVETEYNLQDFLGDEHNADVLIGIFKQVFTNTSADKKNILEMLKSGVEEKEDAQDNGAAAAAAEAAQLQAKFDAERQGFLDRTAKDANQEPSQFTATEFQTPQAFYKAMFHNTNYLESKFRTFFVKDIIIRSLVIDSKARVIPETRGTTGEQWINKALKEKRVEILKRLMHGTSPIYIVEQRLNPQTLTTMEVNREITPDEVVENPTIYNHVIQELQNRVTQPLYKGDKVNLLDPKENNLYKIARDADNDGIEEAKKIVNDYMDFVALHRFDEVLKQSFSGYVSVNEDVDHFNGDLKYTYLVNRKEEASNQNFTEVIRGLETISDLYNIIITNTPVIDVNTGLETKDTLTKPSVQKAFSKYFDDVDPRDSIRSIKNSLIKGMHDNTNLWEDRNTLYTLYKNFYEEYGDDHFGNDYNPNNLVEAENKSTSKYPESYLQTLVYNGHQRDHALMQLLAEPLKNIAAISYAEATVSKYNNTVAINQLSATGKTSTEISIENALFRHLNEKDTVLENMKNYAPIGNSSLDGTVEFTYNNEQYAIKGSNGYEGTANLDVPVEAVHALAKDLFGVDFNGSAVDKDFKNELISRQQNNASSGFPNYFMDFLRQALKVTMAKNEILTNNDVRNSITSKLTHLELKTGNTLINDLFGEGKSKLQTSRLDNYVVRFNRSDTSQPTLSAYKASKDRVTGNSSKSVLKNKEKNSISAYSTYNLFTGFKRNLKEATKLHNSIVNNDPSKNVFSMNALIQDPNFFKGFTYRDAVEVNDTIVSNTKQSVLATLHFDINGSYFSMLQASKKTDKVEVLIDPTVYSDKSKNAMARFSNDLTLDGTAYKLFLVDNKTVAPETQSVDLLFKTNGTYYKKYANNILRDWEKVIVAAGGSWRIRNGSSMSANLKSLNEFNSGDFWYSPTIHPILRGRDAALNIATQVGVALNNGVHYQNKGKTFTNTHAGTPLVVKDTFIKEVALYDADDSSKLKASLDEKLINDANMLRKNGFFLTGDSATFVDEHYKDSASDFGIGEKQFRRYRVVKNMGTEVKSIDDILPAYRKFFYDWNFLTENLLNVALGNIHAHKGGNENAIWTAMTKRNVMAGASIRPYALGLERGVEEFTRTAFVDDIVTPITTIHGDTEPIIDLDGGAFVTMTQRMKTYVSLNEEYQGNGGPEQKPFVSMVDFINGQNGVMKFADFVLDKETIRNSIGSDIDWMRIHKDHLYNLPIAHMDVTKSWNEKVDLSRFDDLYVYRRDFDHNTQTAGRIEKIESIVNIGGNAYEVTKSNPQVKNSVYKERVILNTWYDLWQTLGGIDNVAPSKKKTSIFYTTQNGAKVYFDESDASWSKLLDYEAYAGEKGHQVIKANYIKSSGDLDTDATYELYKTLTGEHDIVMPKLEMMMAVAAGDNDPTQEEYQALGMHHVVSYTKFIEMVQKDSQDVLDFFNHVFDQTQSPEVAQHLTNWQPIKGKLIDRVTTAGAQKFGQFNINRATTFSKAAKANMLKEAVETAANNVSLQQEAYGDDFFNEMLKSGAIVEDCK